MNIFTDVVKDVASAEQAVAGFVKGVLAGIEGDANKILPVIANAAQVAVNVVNAIKAFATSPEGTLLEDLIAAIPGVGPYVDDILKFLPNLVTDLNWVKFEFKKSFEQIVIDGFNWAINASNPDVKATNLATAAAHITTKISTIAGSPIPVQGALPMVLAAYSNTPKVAA